MNNASVRPNATMVAPIAMLRGIIHAAIRTPVHRKNKSVKIMAHFRMLWSAIEAKGKPLP